MMAEAVGIAFCPRGITGQPYKNRLRRWSERRRPVRARLEMAT